MEQNKDNTQLDKNVLYYYADKKTGASGYYKLNKDNALELTAPAVGDTVRSPKKKDFEYLGENQLRAIAPEQKKEEETWTDILTKKRSMAQTLIPGLAFAQTITAPVQTAITYAGEKLQGKEASLAKPMAKAFLQGEGPSGERLTKAMIGGVGALAGKENLGEKFYKYSDQQLTDVRNQTKDMYLNAFGNETFASAMSKVANPFGVKSVVEFAAQIVTDPLTWVLPAGAVKNKAAIQALKDARKEITIGEMLTATTPIEEPLRFVSGTASGIQRQAKTATPFFAEKEPIDMVDFLSDMAVQGADIKPSVGTLEARAKFIRRRPSDEAKKFPFLTEKFTEESTSLPSDMAKRIVSPEFRTDIEPGARSIREHFNVTKEGQLYKETPPGAGGKVRYDLQPELNKRRGVIELKEKTSPESKKMLLPEHAESLIGKGLKDVGFKGTPEQLAQKTKEILQARDVVITKVNKARGVAEAAGIRADDFDKLTMDNFALIESGLNKEVQNAKMGSGSLFEWASYKPNVIAEELKGKAGAIIQPAMKGSREFNNLTSFGYRQLDNYDKVLKSAFKNETAFKAAEARIYDALSNRSNSGNILKSKAEVKAYNIAVNLFDTFKKARAQKGLGVLDEYAPKIHEQLDAMETHLVDFESSLQDVLSRHGKHRTKEGGEVLKGLMSDRLGSRYVASMSRELAFKDLMDVYRGQGYNKLASDHGIYIQDVVNDWMRGMIYPPRPTKMDTILGKVTRAVYDRYLSWNPGAAVQNLPQVGLAKMNINRNSRVFGNELVGSILGTVKEKLPKNIKEYLSDIRQDVFSWTKELSPEAAIKEDSVWTKGIYGESEIYNWARARTWGRVQHLENSEIFKAELAKVKGNRVKALEKVLDNKSPEYVRLVEESKVRGEDLAGSSQVLMGPVAEPRMFAMAKRAGPLKLAAQFKRFDLSALEHVVNSYRDKGKLIAIWRRGFAPEAKVADTIATLNTLEKAVKSSKTIKNQETINNILSHIQDDKKFLWNKVNEIEPQSKAKTLGYLTTYIGKSWLIRKARWLIAAGIWAGAGKKKKEPTTSQYLMSAVPGASLVLDPSSLYSAPALPRGFSKRSLIKKGVFYTPYVGNVDVITGGLIGEMTADAILGKNDQKKRKF